MNVKSKRSLFSDIMICCLLPNILGICWAVSKFYHERNKKYGVIAIVLFTIFLTYNFYSVDNVGRLFRALFKIGETKWYNDDPLTYVLGFFMLFAGIPSSFIFFIYIGCLYVLLFFAFTHYLDIKKDALLVIILIVCTMNLRYSMDLLYFSLSAVFVVYFTSRCDFGHNCLRYVLLIICVYMLHPGLLLVLLPSFFIYYAFDFKYLGYIGTLVLVFLFGVTLQTLTGISTGIPLLDAVFNSYANYTSDSKWGMREKDLSGMTYTILYYVIPVTYYILFVLLLKHYKQVKHKFVCALFQSSALFYPTFLSFVTLTERILVVFTITSAFVMIELFLMGCLKRNKILLLVICVFMFHTIKCSDPVFLHNIFKGNYDSIQLRSYYMPSIMLLDYKDFGFSDEFIRHNSSVYEMYYYR